MANETMLANGALPVDGHVDVPIDVEEELIAVDESANAYWPKVQNRFRAYPVMLRFFGISRASSGCLNLGLLKRMHEEQCVIMHDPTYIGYASVPWAVAVLVGLGGSIAGIIMAATSSHMAALPWWVVGPVIGIAASLFGGIIGTAYVGLKRYQAVYVRASVLQHGDPDDYWRITHIASAHLPRLAFAAEPRNYFFGSTDQAGLRTARLVLLATMPVAQDPTERTRDIRRCKAKDLYDLPPGVGDWAGTSAREQYAILQQVRHAADMARLLLRSKKAKLVTTENLLVLAFTIGAGVAVARMFSS